MSCSNLCHAASARVTEAQTLWGTSGGKFCSLNENHIVSQLLTLEFESNLGSHYPYI